MIEPSGRLRLISAASMLRENPQLRPNIYQVLREVCLMRGTDVPIKDVSRILISAGLQLMHSDLCWPISVRGSSKPTSTLS